MQKALYTLKRDQHTHAGGPHLKERCSVEFKQGDFEDEIEYNLGETQAKAKRALSYTHTSSSAYTHSKNPSRKERCSVASEQGDLMTASILL